MKASEITAGKWEIIPSGNGFIITGNEKMYDVAVVRNIGPHNNEANAKLIAASPRIAALLNVALECLEEGIESEGELEAEHSKIARALALDIRAALSEAGYTDSTEDK